MSLFFILLLLKAKKISKMKNRISFLFLFISYLVASQTFDNKEFLLIKAKYFQHAVNVAEYLPEKHDKFGNTDYTKFVQAAIDENKQLIFPNYPIQISDIGIIIKSNQSLLFQENSSLILKKSAKPAYRLIKISGVENVNIYFPKLVGDKYTHLNNDGQWGNGLSINASKNIFVYKPVIKKFWGDGIYIGNNSGKIPENICVDGGIIDDNRRNGISIISGKDITVKNTIISNSTGHNPQSGIDVEPNNEHNVIQNITLENIITKNNGLHGIIISTGNLNGYKTAPISITINNHQDFNSKIGLGLAVTRANLDYKTPISGTIKLMNSTYRSSKLYNLKNYKGKSNSVKLIFSNVSAGDKYSKTNEQASVDAFIQNFNSNTQYIIK